MKNYYEILEVSPNASQEVIEKAYRALAKKYHPDVSQKSSESKFKEIAEAYDVLSNPNSRKEYDLRLKLEKDDDFRYKKLSEENRKLKNELNYFRTFSPTKRNVKNANNKRPSISEVFKNAIQKELNRSKEERINSLKALIITAIIIFIIIFAFVKIPFLHKIATTFP